MLRESRPSAGETDVGLSGRLRRELTETDAVLWTAVLVATVGDVVTTITGLVSGLGEGNVVVRTALETLGLPGFWLVKFCALLVVVAGWYRLPEREATGFLLVFAVVTLAVVAHNAAVLLVV